MRIKRLLSLVMALFMLFTLAAPVVAFAAEGEEDGQSTQSGEAAGETGGEAAKGTDEENPATDSAKDDEEQADETGDNTLGEDENDSTNDVLPDATAVEPAKDDGDKQDDPAAAPAQKPELQNETTNGAGTRSFSTNTITVKFTNSKGWYDVCVHYWNSDGTETTWPGDAMTKIGSNVYNEDIYSCSIPADVTGLVFNGKIWSGQEWEKKTNDITTNIVPGQWWYATGEVNDYPNGVALVKYDITVNPITGGTITPNKDKAALGETVTLTATPDSGCDSLGSVMLSYNGSSYPIDPNGTLSFTMPAADVIIDATFLRHLHLTDHPAVNATCTTPGNSEYWSCDTDNGGCGKYFSHVNGDNEIAENSWVIPAKGHDWGEPTYEWAEDNSTCTASRVCENDATHVETETVNSTSVGPDDNGVTTYTASFANEAFATQTKQIQTIGPIGGEPIEMGYLYFMKNDGSEEKISQEMSVLEMLAPECPWTRDGFSFIGWNTKADGTGDALQPGDDVKDVLDALSSDEKSYFFYAQWEVAAAPVAKIGDTTYPSLQEAVNAAQEQGGTVVVSVIADVGPESVIVTQNEDFHLTIDGASHKLDGQIRVNGLNQNNNRATLTIKNLNFVEEEFDFSANKFFVGNAPATGSTRSYPHGVTINNCTFTGADTGLTAVYIPSGGEAAYNFTITNVTVSHCRLINFQGGISAINGGLTVDGISGYALVIENLVATDAIAAGLQFKSANNVYIKDSKITAKYALRTVSGSAGTVTLIGDNYFTAHDTADDEGVIVDRSTSGKILVTEGYYEGSIKDTANPISIAITGGFFTEPPKNDFCGEVDGVHLYAVESGRDDEYKYTVGTGAVATVMIQEVDVGYYSFANAAAARKGNYDLVITLLADITEEPYVLTANETLKVKLDGHTIVDPTVPTGYELDVTEPGDDGVTIYTAVPKPVTYVASVTKDGETNSYETLTAAFDAAAAAGEGAIVTILTDLGTEAAPVEATISAVFKGTLDLNGKTVHLSGLAIGVDNCNITITDSAATKGELHLTAIGPNGGIAPNLAHKITLTFENVNVNADSILFHGTKESTIYIKDGAVIHCGGEWSNATTEYGHGSINGMLNNDNNKNAKINVYMSGGEFVTEKGQNIRVGGVVELTGGRLVSKRSEALRMASKTIIPEGSTAIVIGNAYKNNANSSNKDHTIGIHSGAKAEIRGGYFNEPFINGPFDYGQPYGTVTKHTLSFLAEEYMSDTEPIASGEYEGLYGVKKAAAKVDHKDNVIITKYDQEHLADAFASMEGHENYVIKLYVDASYDMSVDQTLNVEKNGHTITLTAPKWYEVVDKGTVNGVTTYKVEPNIPDLPKATIEKVDAHTHIEEWAYSAENGYGTTGEYVETLGVEYKFVLDPETTQEQKDYYSSWGTDFIVSFDADMDANSFGLFGAYGEYNIAFKFPENVNANQEFKLVSWLGQKILGGNGFDIRFSDIKDINFFCGVYNLSAKNCGKTMTVKLVMWDPENPDVIEVRDTVTYTFPTPEMPDAEVTDVTGTHTNIDEYVFTEGNYNVTGTVEELDAEYLFKLKLDTDEREAALQSEYYADWRVDYVVSFNADMTANTFGLFGAYGDYSVAFQFPENIAADNEFKLCEWIAQKTGLEHDFKIKFSDIINFVEGNFYCGVYNLDFRNAGKTMTVKLVMWNEKDPNTLYTIETVNYTFKGFVPPLPEANVDTVKPTEMVKIGEEDQKLEAEYKFTPVEPTEQQSAYYGNWLADYRVSMDANTAAKSFGLFGKYSGYGQDFEQGFLFPQAMTANEPVMLLGLAGVSGVTYNDVVNNIGEFICGVFNKSDDNLGKTITVELVIWDPADPDTKYVIATTPYTFEKPSLPKANVEKITAETVKIDSEDVKLEAEYKFTPVEPTAAQLAYYGNWYADYRVSMDADTAAESFGLYGAYSGYGQDFAQGFLFPQAMTANEPVMLLELAKLSGVTYNDVVNNIGEFICGVFNKSDDNLGKTITVELVIWDPADPDTKYVIATTQYTFKAIYTVTLTSQDTDGNKNIATLTGGGEFESGTEITVTAPSDVNGYTFDGWYKDSYAADNKVKGTYSYTFTVTENVNLIAVYKNNQSTGLLHVIGSTYTVNDGDLQTSNNDFDIPVGDKVKLEYTGTDFLYWVNISNNIVSTSPTYNFTMVGETTIRLITSRNKEQNASVYVVFLNAYSQVQAEGRVIDAEEAENLFPKTNPSKIGETFVKWVFEGTEDEATPDSIAAKADVPAPVVKVVPLYTSAEDDTYTLTVKYRDGSTGDVEGFTDLTIKAGERKEVKLSEIISAVEGLNADDFSYWTLDGTTPVSFIKTSYTVVATKGKTITLTAVFNEATASTPIVRIEQMTATMNGEKYRVSTMMRYEVPEGYTVHESGFVRSTSGTFTEDELVIGAPNTKKHISNFTVQDAIYVMNVNFTDPNKVVYYKAYIIYEKDGELITLYSSMVSGSYNGLAN